MDEYISREEAINAIKSLESSMPAKDNYAKGYDVALGRVLIAVREVPPTADVQPVGQWISVKDRLPDEKQKCLVYRDIDNDLKITTGIWHSEWKAFDGLRHGTRLEDTIAWMPLPEPPKDGDAE